MFHFIYMLISYLSIMISMLKTMIQERDIWIEKMNFHDFSGLNECRSRSTELLHGLTKPVSSHTELHCCSGMQKCCPDIQTLSGLTKVSSRLTKVLSVLTKSLCGHTKLLSGHTNHEIAVWTAPGQQNCCLGARGYHSVSKKNI